MEARNPSRTKRDLQLPASSRSFVNMALKSYRQRINFVIPGSWVRFLTVGGKSSIIHSNFEFENLIEFYKKNFGKSKMTHFSLFFA